MNDPNMISENLSEKPKRGRPRILSQELENECRKYGMYQADTRRSNLNEYFYMKAFAALWNYNPDGEEVAKEEFAYLIHPVTEKMKTVILTELGRLDDPDRIRRNARIICSNKMSTRKAAIKLRQLRAKPSQGSLAGLSREVIALVNDYLLRHPNFTREEALDALRDAMICIREFE
jgi:hypothetical protein